MAFRIPRFVFQHAARDAGAAAITVTSEASGFPKARLADGLGKRAFRFGSSAANLTAAIDLGASPPTVNRMIIPANHTLGGAAYNVQDDDNGSFTSPTSLASGMFAAGTALIDVSLTTSTQRHLRLLITSTGQWDLNELWFGTTRTTVRGPTPNWVDQKVGLVDVTQLRSGEQYAQKRGTARRVLEFEYNRVSEADLVVFTDLVSVTEEGSEPFYFDPPDDGEIPILVRLSDEVSITQDRPNPKGAGANTYSVSVSMIEHVA